MLDCPTYLIIPYFDRQKKVDAYAILDASTRALIGSACELEPKFWRKVFRAVWGRNLLPSEVCVTEPGSPEPVFSMREVSVLWRPRLQVREADGSVLCYLRGKSAVLGGGFTVHDRHGAGMGELDSPGGDASYRLVARDGREIGTLLQQPQSTANKSDSQPEYLAALTRPGEFQAVASVLLLAVTLALDIVFRDRV